MPEWREVNDSFCVVCIGIRRGHVRDRLSLCDHIVGTA